MIQNKAFINGAVYDVISIEEFYTDPMKYKGACVTYENYILPVRSSYETRIGYYPGIFYGRISDGVILPETEWDKKAYSIDHLVDFQNITDIRQVMDAQRKIESDQAIYLTSSDNIFQPNIDPVTDTPLMLGLKQAVLAKQIDINRYQSRFGADFNNDRRKFAQPRISIDKFITIARNLDMKATVIIEDASENVPNPIGHKIVIDLMGDGGDDKNV